MTKNNKSAVRGLVNCLSLVLAVSCLGAQITRAEETREPQRIVTGMKFVKGASSSSFLLGWGIKQFQSDTFYVGGIAYTGSTASGQLGNYSEGGLMIGYNAPAFGTFDLDIHVLIGAGGGIVQNAASSTSAGGLILNPSIGLDAALGKAFKMGLYVGYDIMPNASVFTGLTVEGLVSFLRF